MAALYYCSAVVLALVLATGETVDTLKSYNVDNSKISVSGLSSGGFFAVQFHVAFSKDIMGAGIVAGGPYYCAKGQLNVALTTCMNLMIPGLIDVSSLVDQVHTDWKESKIDDPSNLANDMVFIYSGSKDTVVRQAVVKSLEKFYDRFVNTANIATVYDIPSQHAMVTDDYGNACSTLGSPYINNCHYDTAYNILKHIYGTDTIVPANESSIIQKNLIEFGQSEFFSTFMDNIGLIYVPTACQTNTTVCKLHIAFHGCKQGREYIDDQYALHAGFSALAEVNNIIVVYPQIHKTYLTNPNGCWDWWGYTNADYAVQSGPQMAGVRKILNRVAGI